MQLILIKNKWNIMHSFRTIEKPFRMHVMSWGYYHQSFTNKIDKNQRHHSLGIDRYQIERVGKKCKCINFGDKCISYWLFIWILEHARIIKIRHKNKTFIFDEPISSFFNSPLWIFQQSSLKLSFNPTPASTSKFT